MKSKSLCFSEFLEFMVSKDAGAEAVVIDMLNADRPRTVTTLNKLETLDIRGDKLWHAYSKCHRDPEMFFKAVEDGSIADRIKA
jgi:hypothetical protein